MYFFKCWFFSTVSFQRNSQIAAQRMHCYIGYTCWLFECDFKLPAWDDAKSYFSGTCFSECAFTFPRKWKSFVPFLQKYGDCGRSITNVMNSWRLATLSGNLGRLVIYPTPLDFHRDIWWCFNLKVVSIHFEHFIIDYLSFISSQGNLY